MIHGQLNHCKRFATVGITLVVLMSHGKPSPPKIGEEIPTNWRTNQWTDFSAKQVPSALDLSPRAQTHLPFGCSVVGVMWKPKIQGGGGGSSPGDNFDGDNFHRGKFSPPPGILRLVVIY